MLRHAVGTVLLGFAAQVTPPDTSFQSGLVHHLLLAYSLCHGHLSLPRPVLPGPLRRVCLAGRQAHAIWQTAPCVYLASPVLRRDGRDGSGQYMQGGRNHLGGLGRSCRGCDGTDDCLWDYQGAGRTEEG